MQMTEAEFYGQSIITWQRRLDGFMELHGAKESEADAPLTQAELSKLMEEYPDAPQPAPGGDAPTL